jgi:chromosome segregation ATPase
MAAADRDMTFVDRVSRQGEEALGKLAEELIGNPIVSGAVSRAFEAREKAVQAQEAALGALNIPSAADVERVTRRLRSVSQRLESIEDTLDRLEDRLASQSAKVAPAAKPASRAKAARPKAKKAAAPRSGE